MIKFREYNDIENAYRTKTINDIVEMGLSAPEIEWCVTIKVHGANFSFWYDGNEMRLAKRSCLISDDENFNGSKKVLEQNKDKIIAIYKDLNLVAGQDILCVYGEIFGGTYPHKDVEKVKNVTQVQKGIFYSPDNLFYAFDIRVNENYINYDKAVELFQKHNIFHAKIVFRGTFKQCMEYPNEFKSVIPGWLGLPEIDCANIEEGVVLKPFDAKFFGCGSRVILKNKNDKWKEKSAESKHPKVPKEPDPELSIEAQKLLETFESYVCENRLKNCLSKIGTVTNKDFGKIMGALSIDSYKDFEKDCGEEFSKLDEKEQKRIKKSIGTTATELIRSNFMNILDGNF